MPRVLFFRSELLPFSETFIAGQAAALRRYEAWFAGLKRVPGGLALDGARVISMGETNSLREKIARRIYLRAGLAPEFFQRVEALTPDIVHAHFATDACASLAIQERLRIPMIVTLHGYDVTSDDLALRGSAMGRAYLRNRKLLWERARLFLCVSEFVRRKALERGFPAEKLWVHSIGIDAERFRMDTTTGPKEPLVVFVGRLVAVKGCGRLLRAMRVVESRMPGARLAVVGDGPLRGELEIEARAMLSHCELVGVQSPDAVRRWMQKAAVVAVPSDEREGLCIAACEAQAVGVPVAAFAGSGLAEAVEDGKTGLLVRQGDELALAEALLTLLGDEKLAADMGAAGRRRVERLFNLRTQTALLEAKYDELLGLQ